ncbi:Hybrid PKS-NRPS synthetase lepA [Cladobotryum mycophilum]|uniref:Hybrid PKS-NRPS synthetase lepA n=1 Tax=Cladobotryum mycophilum TaxID=491253 RepID=A0ABR0SWC0_9HYPO
MPTADDGDSFLLFTSGSTGTPKGIRLGQSGIMNYAASKSAMLGLGQIKVLQQTSTGFDMAIAQVFNAFANGGTLVVAPSKSRGDPAMISQIILKEGIEFTLATPSEYMMWATYATDVLRQCTSWRHACSGGEVVSDRLLTALQRLDLPDLTLTDCYGPTEVSCATTFRRHHVHVDIEAVSNSSTQENATSSVGKAIPNTSIYILSEDGSTVLPSGMPGEICVGGSGVARGYLDAQLSSIKFVHDPFATPQDLAKGWGTMYKTGDKGLIQADGSLTFLGRTDGGDTLVKLRGLRIDLEEVSGAILQAAPDSILVDAVVTVRGEPQYLVAHVAFAPGKHMDQKRLNSILQELGLPRYMIPSIIVALDRLPTTPNGKVDRRVLQTLQLPSQSYEKNDNADRQLTVPEGELHVIWLEILGDAIGANNIRADSDFFTVGGSSLLLVRLQAALRERTGVALSLQELYQATTLQKMAGLMSEGRAQLTEEAIDWDTETAIPASILETARNTTGSPVPKRKHRQVLLTGATTFLGGEILLKLIENDEIARIHCIAVGDDDRHKLPSKDNGKVFVYSGSLLSNNLGLSGKEAEFLQDNIDQIVHAAVQGHCMNNYTSVKQALYVSTQTLAYLAIPRRIPFHFISVPRMVLLSGQFKSQPVTMSAHRPPTDGSQGVTASKWASEVFLESLSQKTGLPVAIHRHCALIGERAPADDIFNSVILYSVLSHKVPDVSTALSFFDFKDVEAVASEMAEELPVMAGPVIYRHHSSDVRVRFSKLAEHLGHFYGGTFETVSPAEWIAAARENGLGELLQIHLKANIESGKPLMFPYLGKP